MTNHSENNKPATCDNNMLANRLFKFRAWDNKNKKWLLGYDYPNLGGFDMFGECVLMDEWARTATSFMFGKDDKKLSDLKLMQFTGILDFNKKPIYEGDIVKDDDLGNGIVIFQSGCFFMMYDAETNMEFLGLKTDKFGRLQQKRVVEIIGNVFDNPELVQSCS